MRKYKRLQHKISGGKLHLRLRKACFLVFGEVVVAILGEGVNVLAVRPLQHYAIFGTYYLGKEMPFFPVFRGGSK